MLSRGEVVIAERVDEAVKIILSTKKEADLIVGGVKIEGRFCKSYKILLSTNEGVDSRENITSMAKCLLSTLIFSGGMPFAIREKVGDDPIEWRLAV